LGGFGAGKSNSISRGVIRGREKGKKGILQPGLKIKYKSYFNPLPD